MYDTRDLVEHEDGSSLINLSDYDLVHLRSAISLAMFHGEFSEPAAFFLEDVFDLVSDYLYGGDAPSLDEVLERLDDPGSMEGIYN